MKMRNQSFIFWSLFLLATLLQSCGEFMEFDYSDMPGGSKIEVTQRQVAVMVGDTCSIAYQLKQDEGVSTALYWESRNQEVCTVSPTGVVRGIAEGETRVLVMVLADLQRDSLNVQVLPQWTVSPYDYPYETMLCAQVTVNGQSFDSEKMMLGAFIGDELRGVGVLRTTASGNGYVEVRIYDDSQNMTDQQVSFQLYLRGQGVLHTFGHTIPFDRETHGSPSAPIKLEL